MEDDPFDGLLELEDRFYDEGYRLGIADGSRAGLIEGRVFGLQKGFEKYAAMGELHGRSVVWAGRLPTLQPDCQTEDSPAKGSEELQTEDISPNITQSISSPHLGTKISHKHAESESSSERIRMLSANSRLEKHIRTLYALVEPNSLSTENNEDSVSDFEDRFKRAEGKVKIIQKLTREGSLHENTTGLPFNDHDKVLMKAQNKGEGGIEDINSLQIRH